VKDPKKTNVGAIIRLIVLLALAAAVAFAVTHYNIRGLTPSKIKNYIVSFGAAGPLMFIFLYTIRTLVLFPASIFSAAGGLAFGTLLGALYIYVGATLSAILGYWTARLLGREFVARLLGKKLAGFDELVKNKGFAVVFYLRFFAPFDPLSYACGLSKMKFGSYMIATVIPIIPGTLAFSYFGNSFTKITLWRDLLHKGFLIPAAVLVLTLLLPVIVKMAWPAKKNKT